jgi:DNA-binding NtrC family response regulator
MDTEDYRLLVVDDEEEVVEMICRNLELEGYQVEGVTDPTEALERVREENFQVVISDIKMPELSGPDLLKEIKNIDGIVQVIMITGYVTPSNIISCLSRGANDCLFKPLDLDRLNKTVEQSIEKLERWREVLGEISGLKDREGDSTTGSD